MNTHRVKSGKTGRSGWCFRFTDPVTGRRTHKTFWFGERREAETAFRLFLEGRDSKRLNLPDHSGWCMSYQDLVKRFLVEAPISTERRRARLQLVLGRNECGLQVGSDLAHIGKLSATCRKVQEKKAGMVTRERKVVITVSVSASDGFPPEIWEKKLEIGPPGQIASSIIPTATAVGRSSACIAKRVISGTRNTSAITPTVIVNGVSITRRKSCRVVSSPMLNIRNSSTTVIITWII